MDAKREEQRFHEDWAIDFGKQLIYRRDRRLFQMLKELILKPRYPVLAFYRFARHHEATSTGIVYPEIVDADMLPKIDQIPTRFVLNEPWRIPERDLKTLYLGPLTQNKTILVPPFPKNGFFATIWDVIRVLATLGGAIGFVLLAIKAIGQLL
jgi:hypothetical protein